MYGLRLKDSTILQNLISRHHSKIINGSYAEEGLQSPRCRPTQPLFRSTTFLLNLNMSFTTYTKIVTLLNNIQPRAQKIQLRYTPRTPCNPHHNRTSPPYYPRTLPVSPCECLQPHTGYCRLVNYPVKTKGSKQTSRLPAPTRALTRASTGYLPGHLPEYLRRYPHRYPSAREYAPPKARYTRRTAR